MATQNFFALLEDDENDDPAILAASVAASIASSVTEKQEETPKIANKQPPHAQSGTPKHLSFPFRSYLCSSYLSIMPCLVLRRPFYR